MSLEWLVMVREVRSRATSRAFLVGTAVSLVAVAALVVAPTVLGRHRGVDRVGVVGALPTPLRRAIENAGLGVGVKVQLHPVADLRSAEQDLRTRRLELVVVGTKELVVDQGIDPGARSSLADLLGAISRAVALQAGLERAGIPPGKAGALAHPRPLRVASLRPAPRHEVPLATALIVTVLLFALLQQYGAWVLIGVVEEKTTRVVEVLLAALSPRQLLVGKVAGIGAVALLQGGLTVGVALALAAAFGSSMLAGSGPVFVLVALAWFLLGYAFYCWLFAAAGSLVSRQEDAQNVAFPLMLPLLAGYGAAFSAFVPGRASLLVEVLAYLPPTAPIEMPSLLALGQVTWWQMGASALLTVTGTVLMARLASGIYGRAVLHTGRRLHWREVLPARRDARKVRARQSPAP